MFGGECVRSDCGHRLNQVNIDDSPDRFARKNFRQFPDNVDRADSVPCRESRGQVDFFRCVSAKPRHEQSKPASRTWFPKRFETVQAFAIQGHKLDLRNGFGAFAGWSCRPCPPSPVDFGALADFGRLCRAIVDGGTGWPERCVSSATGLGRMTCIPFAKRIRPRGRSVSAKWRLTGATGCVNDSRE